MDKSLETHAMEYALGMATEPKLELIDLRMMMLEVYGLEKSREAINHAKQIVEMIGLER